MNPKIKHIVLSLLFCTLIIVHLSMRVWWAASEDAAKQHRLEEQKQEAETEVVLKADVSLHNPPSPHQAHKNIVHKAILDTQSNLQLREVY